jgi:hypothetical protein
MTNWIRRLVPLALMSAIAGGANGALLGVVQSFPDVSLGNNYIVYDHNGVDADSGLFRIVSLSSTLNKATGVATAAQNYVFGESPATADVMLSVQISNVTGAFEAGSVTIGLGNANPATPTAPRFSWQGAISAFGFLDDGTQFDARWTLNADQYLNMPSAFSNFVNGTYSGTAGGIKINNSSGFGAGNSWAAMLGRDWVFGTGVQTSTAQITPYLAGLDAIGSPAGRVQLNSTVIADAFVPLPAAAWLLLGGLGLFAPFGRRKALAASRT